MASQQRLQREDRTTQRQMEAEKLLPLQAAKAASEVAKYAAEAEERCLNAAKEAAEAE